MKKGGSSKAVKEGNGGGYKNGGSMTSEVTTGNFGKTKVHQAKRDTDFKDTGDVREGNSGG
jgi:hypothetical protein